MGVSLELVCGVDEAGRGPLAGPVYAAAVVLDPARRINGLADSKVLTEAKREVLAERIRKKSLAWSVAFASVEEIDSINILQASLLAMSRAVAGIAVEFREVLVDGNQCPKVPHAVRAIVGGDATVRCISAASILAKTARDAEMKRLAELYPGYGLDRHKGYSTREHMQAILKLGVADIHRRSFAPVRLALLGPPNLDLFEDIIQSDAEES
ncbi:MAG TPA: ribonuclease HII [Burkholderiales bacterium]|nr:ribonuclease HII [Burkholderiales bacterium]